MKRTSWLNGLWNSMQHKARRPRTESKVTSQIESVEPRQLLSTTALFIPETGELNIEIGTSDNIRVRSQNGNVRVEQQLSNGSFAQISSVGTLSASLVRSIVVVGGDDANTIDMSGVTAASFPAVTLVDVDAGNGHDTIIGSPDLNDSLNGGHGNDTIFGQGGNDTLVGNDGNDSIIAGAGDDSIRGGDGQDFISADAGNDTVEAGDGTDTVIGGDGNDSVFAGNGQDLLEGGAGNDTLNGDGGVDTIHGDGGDDSILGGELDDLLIGDAGNDTLIGQGGNDTLIGVTGADKADGGAGNDLIRSAVEAPVDDPVPAPAAPAPINPTPVPLGDAVDSTLGTNTLSLSHTITTGAGEGGVTVTVTSTGAFGTVQSPAASAGAVYNPLGPVGPSDTTFDSGVYFRGNITSGNRSTLESIATNRSSIRGSANEANSTFSVGALNFATTQVVEPIFDLISGTQIGSLLTQTYQITNTGLTSSEFELVRYMDGDLQFDGSLVDGGGRFVSTAGDEFLFETDAGGLTSPTNFVGITSKGGSIPATNRFEIDQFPNLQSNLQAGVNLDGQIANDTNSDQSIDTNYNVTLALRNTFNLPASGTATYTTHTVFGTGTPNEIQVNQNPIAIADDGAVLTNKDVAIDVVSNDFDSDGTLDYSSIQIVQAPAFGIATPLEDGRVLYTPRAGYVGTDNFIYTIADNLGSRSLPTVVTLNVLPTDTIGDSFNGGGGHDTVIGGDGDDSIFGGSGRDSLLGGLGNDRILGQGGDDVIAGGSGADLLNGGDGNDLLLSAPISVSVNDVSVTEGDTDPALAVFTVGLSAASESVVTVDYFTTGISARSNVDFVPTAGTLTFAPGETTQLVAVSILGDTISESSENFFLTLTNPSNAELFKQRGLATIVDNDTPTGVDLTVNANVNASALARSQTEVHIAVNPTNTQNVVAIANGGGTNAANQFIANSFDGGATWTIRDLGNAQDGIGTGAGANELRFDGAVAFDRFGNLHVVYMADPNAAAANRTHAIIYAVSSDGGITFTARTLDPLSGVNDKPWLAVGPDAANLSNDVVYVTYRSAAGLVARGAVVTGVGAVGAFSAATPFSNAGNFAVPSVGPNGEFVVTWMNPAGGQGPADLLLDRDVSGLVGGLTFGPDAVITSSEAGGFDFIPATPDRSTFASPYLAYDLSNGPNRGRLYVAYADEAPAESNDLNIFVRYSDDNGTSWSAPVRVNDDTGTNSQFFQNISVDPTNGTVYLSWYDARNDVGGGGINSDGITNTDVEMFMSASVDGGLTFGANVQVSTGASNEARDVGSLNDFGDYTGIAAYGDVVYVIWADNSNSTGNNPGGRATFDAYVSRVNATLLTTPSGGESVGTALPEVIDEGDTLLGGAGNDSIFGSTGDDVINGNGDADYLFGASGNDSIVGGAGKDTLLGGDGNDTLDGQGGDDELDGGEGDDISLLTFGGGNDTVNNSGGLDVATVNGDKTANVITVSQVAIVGQAFDKLVVSLGTASLTVDSSVQYTVINALGGNDTVTVGNLDNVAGSVLTVNGGDGDDVLDGYGSQLGIVRMRMNGQNGNDTLNGSLSGETLDGGDGEDSMCGWAGNDTMFGGNGDDSIGGSLGDDSIEGGDGADLLNGQQGNDSVSGGLGNDTLKGEDGDDTLAGQAGDDNLNGNLGNDSLLGGVGRDALAGGAGHDTLDGGRNDDTLGGNSGDDLIRGDHGHDQINGGDGNNTVLGGDGNDTITTGEGNDLVIGGDGHDRVNTDNGDDTLLGGDGDDTLNGGGGQDVLLGGDGNDVINGQGGTDIVAGNQGVDAISDPAVEIDEAYVLSFELQQLLQTL